MDAKEAQNCNVQVNELRKTHLMYIKLQVKMINALQQQFGEEVIKTVQEVFSEESVKPYLPIFESVAGRSVENLVKILWEPLKKMGFQFTVDEIEHGLQIKCSQCPWVNLYEAAGDKNLGFKMVCHADYCFVKQYNPKIEFKRTKTLMQGDDYCDHSYVLK